MAIKVNLLPREERPKRSGISFAMPTLAMGGLRVTDQIPVIILIVVIVVVGVMYYRARSEKLDHQQAITSLKAKDKTLQVQLTELKAAQDAMKEIKRRREILGRVIKGQSVPVAVMNGVLQAVPQGTWLTAFDMKPQEVKVQVDPNRPPITYSSETLAKLEEKKQEAGGGAAPPPAPTGPKREVTELRGFAIVIKGTAFNNFQVAEFMDNLRKLKLFTDVEFTSTQAAAIEQVRVVNFEVTASVKL